MRITNSTKNTRNKLKQKRKLDYRDPPFFSIIFLKKIGKAIAIRLLVSLIMLLLFSVWHYYKTENKTTFNMTIPVDSKTQTTSANEYIA